MKSSTAFWITPDGEIIPVKTAHIAAVIAQPERFGHTKEQLEDLFQKHAERLGQEGKARAEIVKGLVAKGWIRIRLHPDKQWSINVAVLDQQVLGVLAVWAGTMLQTEGLDPHVPVRISIIEGGGATTTLRSLAGGKEFDYIRPCDMYHQHHTE